MLYNKGKGEKDMAGQPTKYKYEYNEQVTKLCRLGATDKEIADFFNICEATVNNWKKAEPQFLESIKKGKIEADMNVAESLYKRAMGYEYEETKVSNNDTVITTKQVIPDTAAIMAWLNNRRPESFRSKQYVESENVNHNLNDDVSGKTEEELDEIIKKLQNDNG